MYAIIDIETTGGSPTVDKITEIAIYLFDGIKIKEEFSTLVNPETRIPHYITNLTGISDAMVSDAPKFYEIARQIVELTQNSIFVAHNVSFDYQFIRNEFKRLGFDFFRKKLCTVQLSRRLIPNLKSYSLGKLCKQLGIEIAGRHRAAGDALATLKLLEHLLRLSSPDQSLITHLPGFDKKDLHPNLNPEIISELPEETGVYYFFNDKEQLIYIGKSKNIRNRVLTHFRNFSTKKSIEMRNAVAGISFEKTGSELVALLKESHEIKIHKPLYNRSQRRSNSHFGLYSYKDQSGYIHFAVDQNHGKSELPLCSFSTQRSGKNYLHTLVDKYQLCQQLCGLYPNSGACFHYEIAECKGACIGRESAKDYNKRAEMVIDSHKYKSDNFFIVDRGKNDEELGVVLVECGKYIGYGFQSKDCFSNNPGDLRDCIQNFPDNRDTQQIIRNYLRQNMHVKIIPFHVNCL